MFYWFFGVYRVRDLPVIQLERIWEFQEDLSARSLAKSEMGFKSSHLCIPILTALLGNFRVPSMVANGVIYNCAALWLSVGFKP